LKWKIPNPIRAILPAIICCRWRADFADQVDFAIEASEIPRSQVILAGAPLESVSLENGETNVCTDPQRGISVRVFGWFDMRTARRRFRLELLAGLGDPR
jgi:hypothetical protein